VVTITGGKLTTYREMAADTVDVVLRSLDHRVATRVAKRSRTKNLRLRGAEGYEAARLAGDPLSVHLADRYGGEARTLHAMIDADPALGEPLVAGLPYVRAEAVYAARYEMARTVDDVLSRRTRARLLSRDASAAAAPDVAELIGEVLGLPAEERTGQAAAYQAAAKAERASAGLPETPLDAILGG
jgi:glycerol-3-phosphate dehydrogenase